jgi:hypothetical protein
MVDARLSSQEELDKMIADVFPKQAAHIVTRNGNPTKVCTTWAGGPCPSCLDVKSCASVEVYRWRTCTPMQANRPLPSSLLPVLLGVLDLPGAWMDSGFSTNSRLTNSKYSNLELVNLGFEGFATLLAPGELSVNILAVS